MKRTLSARYLPLLLATIACFAAPTAGALPRTSLTVSSTTERSSDVLHITLRTPEGLERFTFTRRSNFSSHADETHYRGFSRTRNGETEKLPSALTLTPTTGWMYFSSHRTGRPVSATFSLDAGKRIHGLSIRRVPSTSLACGSHVGENSPIRSSIQERRHSTIGRGVSTLGDESPKPFSPLRILEVATEADYDFSIIHGAKTNTFIRSIINATDVLYTSSLGITLKIVDQKIQSSEAEQPDALTALSVLENFRTKGLLASSRADVRHLFTGKSLDGFTIGIAYVSATCQAQGRYSAGLSRTVSSALHPYLAAHEIGHNLSAAHDNVPRSVMNPAITSANNQFSTKTRTDIHEFVRLSGGCLDSERVGDVRFSIDPTDPTVFNSTVTFVTPTTLRCHVTLLGSQDGERFVTLSTQKLSSLGSTARTSVSFTAALPTLEGTQRFTFQSKVTCGGTMKLSKSAPLKVGTASSNTITSNNGTRWLHQLRDNLS